MNAAAKRILSALLLLLIFGLALYLRFYGADWALKDKVYSPHPDERHYESCASIMRPQWLSADERKLPLREKFRLLYERNLDASKIQGVSRDYGNPASVFMREKPGLAPINYNYGTFPLHLYLLYQEYLKAHSGLDRRWTLLAFPDWLSGIAIALVLFIGLRLFILVSRDLRQSRFRPIPWHKDDERLSLFFPSIVLPIVSLILFLYIPYRLIDFSQYDPQNASILLTGRILTAWLGALTVLLVYLIGRDAYSRAAGLLGALMLTTAMLHVQTSHYITVDAILGFWATAAVYCFLKISQKPRLIWYILGAICSGFAVSAKWSGVTLPGILLLAHAIATWGDERHGKTARAIHSFWLLVMGTLLAHFYYAAKSVNPPLNVTLAAFRDFYLHHWIVFAILNWFFLFLSLILLLVRKSITGGKTGFFRPAWDIYRPWLWLGLAIPIGVTAFYIGQPMAYFDSAEFGRNMAEQAGINMTGARPVPYTQQFRNTWPFFYSLDNLFYPSLDYLTAFFVFAGCLYAFVRIFTRRNSADLLLSAWVIPSFLMYSSFSSKFPRYLVIILPVMMLMGGRLIADLARLRSTIYIPDMPWLRPVWKKALRFAGIAGGAAALVCGLIYGRAYVGIYDQPHTLVTAGRWMQEHMRPGSHVTQQSWDEGITGVHTEWSDMIFLHDRNAEESNPLGRVDYYTQILNKNDYIVLQSKRGYGSTMRNPDQYPVTNKLLRALFAEQLGFRIAKVITNPPHFLGWAFRTDEEDETARIYDHPKIVIFEKVHKFDGEQLRRLILEPPDWVNQITDKEIYRARDGYPVFMAYCDHPALSWWLAIQVLGWIGFLFLFPLCAALPDRGYVAAKVAGIALFSWLCWIVASVNVIPFSRMQCLIVFLLLLLAACIAARKQSEALLAYLREKWLLLIGLEGLYLLLWILFLVIRAYHPAALWGEKPMNFSFINAVYRADGFPPEDPWFSGYWTNYYYYGQAVFSIIGRFIGVPPEYLFNVAGASVSALAGLCIFSIAYALCRRTLVSLLALYLALFAGHVISYINIVREGLDKGGPTIWFSKINLWDCILGVKTVFHLIWLCLMSYLGLASDAMLQEIHSLNWDLIFWQSRTDIFLGSVANEFPFWTNLFMDFHAHMLVVPFSLTFLILLYAYFAHPRSDTNLGRMSGMTFFLGLLLGTVICANTWDLPGLMLGLLFATAVKFWRESEFFQDGPNRPAWLSPDALRSLARFPIGHFASVLILAVFLYLPFHFHFISRVSEVRFMTEGNTPITAYLGFWIHILFPVVIAIFLLAVVRKDGGVSLPRTMLFAAFLFCSAAFALWFTRANPLHYPPPHPFDYPPYVGWIKPMDYRVVGLFAPFLTVLFFMLWKKEREPGTIFACLLGVLGLGLSLGIEFFYVKEIWSEPRHRYNTDFKFNLQIWLYLSIFAALGIGYSWDILKRMGEKYKFWTIQPFRAVYLVILLLLLALTLPFVLIAPAVVTQTARAHSQSARGNPPTLDGMEWIKSERYEAYAAIKWLNRFVPGTPNIVERRGGAYNDTSRFCTNTGLPALIGWAESPHIGERIHFNNERYNRIRAEEAIFGSSVKKEVLNQLGLYDIEYLIFSDFERRPAGGPAALKRFEEWGDVFRLVYRYGETSIFHIDKNLNAAYGLAAQSATPAPLPPPAKRPPEFGVSMFEGGTGSGNGQFEEGRGMAQNAEGRFYIADTRNHRIQVFNPDGSFAWKLGEEGDGEGQFREPNGIAIDPQTQDLFVTDTWNQRVVRLSKDGQFVGSASLGFYGPRGIAYHPIWKILYITDTGNHQVKAMTLDGQLQQTWGTPGGGSPEEAFVEPVGIGVMPDGNVIALDSKNIRLKVYSPDGKLLRFWRVQTEWDGSGGFEGHIACSPDGTIYLSDPNEKSVHIYTPDGELSGKITSDLAGRRMMRPVGLLYTSDRQLLVTDLALNRVLRLR
ncbi:MAG: DUF2298 domain-containing protein [Candidatus Omnitrophota bacterium]